jgi:hypothetical protein
MSGFVDEGGDDFRGAVMEVFRKHQIEGDFQTDDRLLSRGKPLCSKTSKRYGLKS